MPTIEIDNRTLHFWLQSYEKAILFISTDRPISRKFFRKPCRGFVQLEKEDLTVETVKTDDHAKTLIRKEWNTGKWRCSNDDELKKLLEEVEEEEEKARIEWDKAINKGKVDTKLLKPEAIERDFNDRIQSGEVEDLDSYKKFVKE